MPPGEVVGERRGVLTHNGNTLIILNLADHNNVKFSRCVFRPGSWLRNLPEAVTDNGRASATIVCNGRASADGAGVHLGDDGRRWQ